ncbi:ATP-binding protein [Campylobacter sp. MIT 21-1685]|uniref:ATP-binding protein n=1 Tax=unclassified Campylobacter TaxID=2593542 RepID=UPI00224A4B93|nr:MULTISPECIES: ATP-binding protein [unclassified Campylobacter]MCX2683768.1 ATP-binding protein [Campylobacter sp. MIT 21-1684]MCX2752057.1 ATP-binding protein [Campylobacter sp. MIT 21-1682]MCX2808245.1 ATP-binding protein [Campylobacter sp. MIT 21-1685]
MKVLNFFYENYQKLETSYERKVQIIKPNVLIKGPRHCGKKTLIYNYLSAYTQEQILFLDLYDIRFELSSLENLVQFLQLHTKIQILCMCNLDFVFDIKGIKIPIIASTQRKDLSIVGFNELELDYFDFEEFISLSKKNLPINSMLGLFLQTGRSGLKEKDIRCIFSRLELEILKYIAKNLAHQISIRKLFLELKKKSKVSKDSVYQAIKVLENSFLLYVVFHDEKNLKKVYFRDFAFRNALCIQKDFKALFENAILTELFKLKTQIFYNKFFTFYIKNSKTAYIASATLDVDLITIRARKILPKALELGVFHIFFITLSSEKSFFEQGVKFEIVPFEKWALSF